MTKTLMLHSRRRHWLPISLVSLLMLSLAIVIYQGWSLLQGLVHYCQNLVLVQYAGSPLLLATVIMLISALVIGLGRGLWFIQREIRRIHTALRSLALRAKESEDAMWLIKDEASFAFTLGWWHPIIIYSTGLTQLLTETELEAVLLHEVIHQQQRHPLKRLVAAAAAQLCWFLPIVSELVKNMMAFQEQEADQAVVKIGGYTSLMNSMRKLVLPELSLLESRTACSLSVTPERLHQLSRRQPGYNWNLRWSAVVTTVAVFLWGIVGWGITSNVRAEPTTEAQICQRAQVQTLGNYSRLQLMSNDRYQLAPEGLIIINH